MEEVQITATRSERLADSVPTAVTTLKSTSIQESQAQTLPEALRGQAGAFVQQTTPGQSTVIVRGLKGSQVLYLVDGMRLNTALFRDAPTQYFALVDPFIVERLEVALCGSAH